MGELRDAVVSGKLEVVMELLDKENDLIDERDEHGLTCLHRAAARGHTELVKLLLDRGARKDIKHLAGDTALHRAAKYGREDCLKLLLKAGCDKSLKNGQGFTPADLANQGGFEDTVNALEQWDGPVVYSKAYSHAMDLQLGLGLQENQTRARAAAGSVGSGHGTPGSTKHLPGIRVGLQILPEVKVDGVDIIFPAYMDELPMYQGKSHKAGKKKPPRVMVPKTPPL